ncbi:hypothetical protein ACH5RR_013606 [Cinchona calisaya]|uniref:Uncharacterized protein n=1 Tax=Cinchona calisaya TaxID=153742 RepID=A0ABD3A0L6_9GENT
MIPARGRREIWKRVLGNIMGTLRSGNRGMFGNQNGKTGFSLPPISFGSAYKKALLQNYWIEDVLDVSLLGRVKLIQAIEKLIFVDVQLSVGVMDSCSI